MRKVVLLTLCLGLLAAPAWATVWSDGIDHGNQGFSMVDTGFTITARTGLLAGENPLTTPDRIGTIYWGKLGTMDATPLAPAKDFYGLGVQSDYGLDKNGNQTAPGGSEGISGEGGAQNEALVFTFNPMVDADSVSLHLVGINVDGKNNDVIDIYVAFGTGLYANVAVTAVNGEADLALSSIPNFAGNFGSFAIQATEGHFGVGSLTGGDPVIPIPPTVWLMGSGLLGLVGLRWRRRKTDV